MSCQHSTGNWVAMMVEARPWRSSITSIRSRRCSAVSFCMSQSSRMRTRVLASVVKARA